MEAIVTTKVQIRTDALREFATWQSQLHAVITSFSGFISLEIISAASSWEIIQCFSDQKSLSLWLISSERKELLEKLSRLLVPNSALLEGDVETHPTGYVTEIFVTEIKQDQENSYRKWIAKIHETEATFPGFRGVYVKSPESSSSRYWITLLQFDSPENLDRWLQSDSRKQILKESHSLITSMESQRMLSSYGGWFSTLAKQGEMPSVVKQTMVVLLVLFPIVMLQIKFLFPLLSEWNLSTATFLGNAISVTLIAWPLMPIAIRLLDWWLLPKGATSQRRNSNIFGTLLICFLYFVEVLLFLS